MCGIAGQVGAAIDPQEVEFMVDAQRHRGPDDGGIWSGPGCVLGNRRLSILDLSPAGHQPLSNAAGTLWVTFNGEIYNFQELRRELESLGYSFRTRTDTEVLVTSYERWGTECVRRLRGMFAFALWDQPRRRLFLARDRVGKKPLFYACNGGEFRFASELQGLLACPRMAREVDVRALDFYLTWGYVPAPHTAFRGIQKLPPAHWMTVEVSTSGIELRCERYWSLEYVPKRLISEGEAVEELREKLSEAVRLRMISDVPLGAFLSGGIDSSIVVGLMAKVSGRPVKTFSIGFKEAAYDELEHARRVARWNATDHHELVVEPDSLAVLPKLVRHYGEPFADSSAVPTFYVAQITRQQVTVALNGDGGDESFAGYERYLGIRLAKLLQAVPGAKRGSRALHQLLPDTLESKGRLQTAKRFLGGIGRTLGQCYGSWLRYLGEDAKRELYSADFNNQLSGAESDGWLDQLFSSRPELDPMDAAMSLDVQSYLPYDLLVKVDITSMANSLEARSPFLDHEVMEFSARLPVEMKQRAHRSKYLLRRAFADLLPPENLQRRKMGFGVPVGKWLRTSLSSLLQDTLLSPPALNRGYFQPATVRRLVGDHLGRRADRGPQLWNLLMLELWQQLVVEGKSSP